MPTVPPRRRAAPDTEPPPAAPPSHGTGPRPPHALPGHGHGHDHAPLRPPGPLMLMLEGRAPWEWAAMLAATPWLRRLPAGDGHAVMVLPGLGANDWSTQPLRAFLAGLGYEVHPWRQGFNFGPRHGVLHRVTEQARLLWQEGGRTVSLVGWSLGGLYAREAAKRVPQAVRCVVTLGTPFTGHPRATNAWRFYEAVSGQSVDDPDLIAQIRTPPPVPTTSIYSRTDGIVHWRCSLEVPGPRAENIEVHASHVGMGMNPMALYAVADRLAQDPARWMPFDVHGARRWFYRTPITAPGAAG